ncbi:hypothetical protein A2U01_0065742, partial [Trifolium medium]|nr:hypothetical protein [Trifolium medium]
HTPLVLVNQGTTQIKNDSRMSKETDDSAEAVQNMFGTE